MILEVSSWNTTQFTPTEIEQVQTLKKYTFFTKEIFRTAQRMGQRRSNSLPQTGRSADNRNADIVPRHLMPTPVRYPVYPKKTKGKSKHS